MEKSIKIAIDMYFAQLDACQHRDLGEQFLRSESVLDNLMDVVSHFRDIEANNYAKLSHYNAAGKLNYLQHLYVVFVELRRFVLTNVKSIINDLSDMFYRYHDKHLSASHSIFNYTFRIVFHTYLDNRNKANLPSALAQKHNICKNQPFEQVLNSFLKQADAVLLNYSSLDLEYINKTLKDAVKSNYAMSL